MKILQVSKVVHGNTPRKWMSGDYLPVEDRKVKISLDDSRTIEAGVFSFLFRGRIEHHACISTQVGCKFGCQMCSSGRNGFFRNLTHSEIIEQIALLEREVVKQRLDEILFMGIGEPLDNYDNFVAALTTLAPYSGKLAFATVGLPQKLIDLSREVLPALRMAWISLHASDDRKRASLMPVAKMPATVSPPTKPPIVGSTHTRPRG